jgi:hypothetical protein
MGVENMNNVSGRGYYTSTFNWDGTGGAYISLVYGNDQITGVTINGKEIRVINNITDTLDIGQYLFQGSNEIIIELTTTLNKRAKMESAILAAGGKLSFGGTVVDDYGLKKVVLQPYFDTTLNADK